MARKVLIVEDESNIAELINLYLKKEGYETMVAGDGGKALELYRLFRPDLVLLDIMLPVMDGWAVCAKIRETDKTPIIMLTAKGETIDKVAGLEMGADDYIVKPLMDWSSTWIPTSWRSGASGSTPRPRSWSSSSIWPPPPTGCLPGTNCWTRSGDLTTLVTPAQWMYTSSGCGKSWRGSATSGP